MITFDSFEEGAEVVSKGLKENGEGRGLPKLSELTIYISPKPSFWDLPFGKVEGRVTLFDSEEAIGQPVPLDEE